MADQQSVVNLNETARRRMTAFDAEFVVPAERALIAIHKMVEDELDGNPDPDWCSYHTGPAAQFVEELQARYRAWEDAFYEAENQRRRDVARVATEEERAENARRHDAARRDLYPVPEVQG